MSRVRFEVSPEEKELIRQIVDRAIAELPFGEDRREDLTMDLTACHANGCPLWLNDLLRADKFNFAHDVLQIPGHIDRRTGMLNSRFLPRFARKSGKPPGSFDTLLQRLTGR
ncbi:MAG: hypothetical protein ACLFWF_10910 [Alphaproteobacteria bacterium]